MNARPRLEVSRRDLLRGAAAGVVWMRLTPAWAHAEGWTQLATTGTPPARTDHGLSYDSESGVVYLFGGRDDDGVAMNDLWALDLASATWTQVTFDDPAPAPRFTPIIFWDVARDRLVVATGQGAGFFNDVWAFDPAAAAWSELGADATTRPERRYGAGGAYDPANDRFFVTHGFTSKGRFDDTWTFALNEETWTQLEVTGGVPLKRCLLRGAWDSQRGRLLLFGGQSNQDSHMDDLWSLNVVAGMWRERKADRKPSARNLYGAAFDDERGRWWLFGGSTEAGPTESLWRYDTATKSWRRIRRSPQPSARSGADIVVAGNKLILFGGYDGNGVLADTWELVI
ncbi:MAG: Kelch repeat-containing protein [Actinomycetota bacterium]